MQTLEDWIVAQREALVRNWQLWQVPPAVAIEGPQVLGQTFGGPEGRATVWQPLERTDASAALVQRTDHVVSLWVDPRRDNYVTLYERFLTRHCQVDAGALTADYDVDHMYNRERAINFGYAYVRMFPIPKGPNRSHGAGYEKAMTESDIGRFRKPMKLMDEVSTMKFFGIASPSAVKGYTHAQRAHMQTMAGLFDLTVEQIEQGVSGLMARAHRK